MYRISKKTKVGYGIIFLIHIWLAFNNIISYYYLLICPIVYALMYLCIKIFIWDKRKQLNIILSKNAFRKGDLISICGSEQTVLVLKVNTGVNNQITATVFPLKTTKYKLVNFAGLWYVKIGYWLRNVGM